MYFRYIAIIYPMRSKQMTTLCLLRVIVIVVWILAAAYGAPYLYIYDIVKVCYHQPVSSPGRREGLSNEQPEVGKVKPCEIR